MQSVNYSEKLKKRFAENNGRLFFVDGSKSRAFLAIKEIFSVEKPTSSLCVVNDLWTAEQVKVALYKNSEAKIISNVNDFKNMCREINADLNNAQRHAVSFREKYANVIITRENTAGNPLLHAELCKAKGKSGEYIEGDRASYLVSDFLCDAEYSMVVIDNVYDMYAFERAENDEVKGRTPQQYERMDFMGKLYFTDINHSYKRLMRLVDSADKAIVTSDIIIDRELITFYAAANLVHNSFSYKKMKAQAKVNTSLFEEEADILFDTFSFAQGDDSIESICLQKAAGRGQIVPNDITSFDKYFSGNLDFMTKEEIFLRALFAASKEKEISSNKELISRLENKFTMAAAICDMLFSDALKADIESMAKTTHTCRMSAEEFADFMNLFSKYAVYCDLGEIGDVCNVYRIYHDNSGFEDLVRRNTEAFDSNINSFSASRVGDDVSYKCIAIKNLIKNGELRLPLLAVTLSSAREAINSLSSITELDVSRFAANQTELKADSISVITYDEFASLANNINIASAVFFDVTPDINRLDTYIKKAINFGENVNVGLLTTYDNISGLVIDSWQKSWLSGEYKVVPVRNTEVYIKGSHPLDYYTVVEELDSVYKSFKNVIDGISPENVHGLVQRFSAVITNFTLNMMAHMQETEEEFEYFSEISSCYSEIFANSVSVGAEGRKVFSEKKVVEDPNSKSKKKKKKNKKDKKSLITEYEAHQDTDKVIFNVCAKKLHQSCDYKKHDCFRCNHCGRLILNSTEAFADSVKKYFDETLKKVSRIHTERMKRDSSHGAISHERVDMISIPTVRDCAEDAREALDKLFKSMENSSATFFGDYDTVIEIKDAVQTIHYKLFEKYYEQLKNIFEKATNQMKKSFETAGQGAKTSASAL